MCYRPYVRRRSLQGRISIAGGLLLVLAAHVVGPSSVQGVPGRVGAVAEQPLHGAHLPRRDVGFLHGASTALGSLQPLENRLSAGTTNLLRSLRKRVRQVVRNLRYGAGRWTSWLGGLILFLVVGLVVPLLGVDNLRTFRREGFLAFLRELSLALAVYVRLLFDSRTPVVGKALLGFAVAYGAASRDLFPDRMSALSFADDLVLLVLASRSFMMLCPQEIVEEHALAAARAREENLRKKIGRRRRRAAKEPEASSSAAPESNG